MFHIIWSIIYMIWSIWNRFRIQIYVNSPKLKFSASIWKMFQLLGESSSQTLWKDDRCFWRCSGVRRRNYHGWFVRRWKNWPRRYGSWRTIRNGFETTLYRMASGRQVHPSLVITMDHGPRLLRILESAKNANGWIRSWFWWRGKTTGKHAKSDCHYNLLCSILLWVHLSYAKTCWKEKTKTFFSNRIGIITGTSCTCLP